MSTTNPTFPPTWTITLPSSCWGYKNCSHRSNSLIAILAILVQMISAPLGFQSNRTIKHLEYPSITLKKNSFLFRPSGRKTGSTP